MKEIAMREVARKELESANHIQSVVKAINILELLAAKGRELSLSEIARDLEQAKSTVHGILSTLRDYGYVRQSSHTGKYTLGIRLFEIGNKVTAIADVRTVASPYLIKLGNEVGETVQLAILDQGEVLYIDKKESQQSIYIATKIGSRLAPHCSGLGKVLLSELPVQSRRQLISEKGLVRLTKNTITDPDKLEQELARVREQGYAIDNEESMNNLRCVAAPIRDHEGKIIAALSVSGPVFRLTDSRVMELAEVVVDYALQISSALGYRAQSV